MQTEAKKLTKKELLIMTSERLRRPDLTNDEYLALAKFYEKIGGVQMRRPRQSAHELVLEIERKRRSAKSTKGEQ